MAMVATAVVAINAVASCKEPAPQIFHYSDERYGRVGTALRRNGRFWPKAALAPLTAWA